MELKNKSCLPCEGSTGALSENEENKLMTKLSGWTIDRSAPVHKLLKDIKSEKFMDSVNKLCGIAFIADRENHHPDLHIYYNKLHIVLYTHKINGLSENDFILASKIDEYLEKRG